MTSIDHTPIVVGEPNWRPLEMAFASPDCECYVVLLLM